MDVQALLATLMAEREKLTKAIVALEGLRGPSAVAAVTKVKAKAIRKRRSRSPRQSDLTKALIVASMRKVADAGGALRPMAAKLATQYGVSVLTITNTWRTWERNGVNGQTVAFTAEETAQATHDPS